MFEPCTAHQIYERGRRKPAFVVWEVAAMGNHPPASSRPESKLYHNPRCSKSRSALVLLRERGIEPCVVAYLETPPSANDLRELLRMLALSARELLRSSEAEYDALGLDDPGISEDAIIAAMAAHPQLIERPIFVHEGRAVIGRPPERVLELID